MAKINVTINSIMFSNQLKIQNATMIYKLCGGVILFIIKNFCSKILF